jgi:hypothetical protein
MEEIATLCYASSTPAGPTCPDMAGSMEFARRELTHRKFLSLGDDLIPCLHPTSTVGGRRPANEGGGGYGASCGARVNTNIRPL